MDGRTQCVQITERLRGACVFTRILHLGDFISVLYIETKDSKPGKPIVDAYNADMVQKKV